MRQRITAQGNGYLDREYTTANVEDSVYSNSIFLGSAGGYCLKLSFTPRNIQVTNADPGNPVSSAYLATTPSQCPEGYRGAAVMAQTTVWILIS